MVINANSIEILANMNNIKNLNKTLKSTAEVNTKFIIAG